MNQFKISLINLLLTFVKYVQIYIELVKYVFTIKQLQLLYCYQNMNISIISIDIK